MAPIGTVRPVSTMLSRKKKGKSSKRRRLNETDVIRIARGVQETKQKLYIELSYVYSNNVPACWNLTSAIGQGTASNQRIGDKIWMSGFKMRFEANLNSTAAGQTDFRMLLVWSTVQSSTQTALTINNLFLDGQSNAFQGVTDSRKVKVLFDKTYRVNQLFTAGNIGVMSEMYKKINQEFAYLGDSSIYGETLNLYLVMIPHSIGTFAQPYFAWSGVSYFKDA